MLHERSSSRSEMDTMNSHSNSFFYFFLSLLTTFSAVKVSRNNLLDFFIEETYLKFFCRTKPKKSTEFLKSFFFKFLLFDIDKHLITLLEI
jgi:hypothetical protein